MFSTVINVSSKIVNAYIGSSKITELVSEFKVRGPMADFLEEMGIKATNNPKIYRDIKTGRGVSYKVVDELFAHYKNPNVKKENVMDNKIECAYENNPTGIEEVEDKDVFKALPNWDEMDLEKILPYVSYHRKEVRAGVEFRVPLKDEEGQIIPVSKAGDGGEFTMWSQVSDKDDPETVALNRAARAEIMLLNWGYDLSVLRKDVEHLKAATCIGHLSPFQDGEEMIEILQLRQQEKEEKAAKAIRRWVINLFPGKKEEQKKFLRTIRNEVEKVKAMGEKDEDISSEEMFQIRSRLITHCTFGAIMDDKSGRWLKEEGMPNIPFALEKHLGGRLTNDTKKMIGKYVSLSCWNSWRKAMNEAVKGTLIRWIGSEIQMEVIKVLAENQSVDRQVENLIKTDIRDVFKKEQIDYMWENRMDNDQETVRRNGKWIPTEVLTYALLNQGKHPFLK